MSIELGQPGDYHVHLRDGDMMNLVTPTIPTGGVSVCYVMPNLNPPIVTPKHALAYKAELQALSPTTTFLMSMYLSPSITPEMVFEAAKSGVSGIKCYPAGVTTNSEHGVSSYEAFYPVFSAMEEAGLVLNLHGECPCTAANADYITVLNAEEEFLPTLKDLHSRFPKLRIILEHCTTAAAVQAVRECGPTVVGTITAHHLYLIVDNWGGNALHFCKPVAKWPHDRRALIDAATSGDAKFFLGTDSAPHPLKNKRKAMGAAAGVFTQSHAIPYVAQVFEAEGKLDTLKAFVTDNGRKFYNWNQELSQSNKQVRLIRKANSIPASFGEGDEAVIPFKAGESLNWSIEWY
ncbi:Dihydroorotase [Nadsonia fulvescens var. elongata DSM 6958]|uniref:dihydroorotase n=1 Tax=Nadsonia fulvescens var. elongata DSM 6958 TaxID=857566 RepID=A0A1E3PCA1_9ASCO|nr:Dihydroorotase [Nadsonia fulvescens var. elongata DSM 6958]